MSEKYKGLTLTPNVFIELMIEHLDGKQFKRKDAINIVMKKFEESGGSLEDKDYVSTFKHATRKMTNCGLENKGYGIWSLQYSKQEIEVIAEVPKNQVYHADEIIGAGKNSIYLYYYDVYHRLSKIQNKDIWECKIGKTDGNALDRIISQSGTAYPEKPHVALIINCDDSSKLENALHSVLKFKGRWIESAPGTEWFYTNPNEVKNIYYELLK